MSAKKFKIPSDVPTLPNMISQLFKIQNGFVGLKQHKKMYNEIDRICIRKSRCRYSRARAKLCQTIDTIWQNMLGDVYFPEVGRLRASATESVRSNLARVSAAGRAKAKPETCGLLCPGNSSLRQGRCVRQRSRSRPCLGSRPSFCGPPRCRRSPRRRASGLGEN